MKVAIIGASGYIGKEILAEALNRGHQVTAIVRDVTKITDTHPQLTVVKADVLDEVAVAAAVKGNEAVISSYNAGQDASDILDTYGRAIRSILNGVKDAGIHRFLAVSGAGSLEIEPGLQLLDTPEFPELWKAGATATREAFYTIKAQSDLDWTVISPAMNIEPGPRTGVFRLGRDQVVADAKGESRISTKDFAVAVIDELEKPQHIKQRFTLAY
ncbi:hypothetical protein GA0116948_10785 [Chitinophaga costaii]|uniref:NAD(P)-binding domain-containing protein n=1 Tax=Chitinophaga costaii TaxID=1335309 RepID=A0A1C4E4F9_9BACT|nr:NAD(P)-dependent oxidoreductase [Chitinophaga costaii]PUZ24326.1 NAD(P)-dependent oxidoreductase [Chitinophaga costaii]SCC38547.1 hypothetical protein GA0116948_10785 [Chitinophaga costaii]